MFSRPEGLSDADVARGLAQGCGLERVQLEYAPVGFGSYHWQVRQGGRRWFATVDDLHARRWDDAEPLFLARGRLAAALGGARWVQQAGLDFVVAPLPEVSGGVLRDLDERYLLALYPFVEGRTASYDTYLDREQRTAVVGRLAQLHAVDPGGCTDVLADDFALPNLNGLHEALADLTASWGSGPFAEPTRSLLARHAGALTDLLERYLGLVASIVQRGTSVVLTHGEPHLGNTIGTEYGILLIDWDTLLLAPPERDLWSLQVQDDEVIDVYRKLTGRDIDPDALDLYRIRWDLTDVCLYVTQFRRPHRHCEDAAEAWDGLQHHLDPSRW
jgi:spectinomycin phosphotransferase